MSNRRILPIPLSVLPNSYGAALSLTMDEDYIIRGQLLDQHGEPLGEEQVIDTPMEMSIIGGTYDDQTQSLILELQNGDTISIPISSLIAGLQAEITTENPLSADLLTDGTNNKVFTAAEQTKLSGIAAGAEVNVQANWNESDSSSDSYIQNKPTLGTMAAENASDYTQTSSLSSVALSGSYTDLSNTPTIPDAQVNSDWNASSGVAEILNKPTIPTVNDATITLQDGNGTALGSFTTNDANNQTITIPASGGGNEWFGSQAQFDAISSYDADTDYFISDKIDYNTDIKHKPNLNKYAVKTQVDAKNNEQDSLIDNKMEGTFLTEQEYSQITPKEGENYFIEGTTVQMEVTFSDQTTATYNVVID